MSSDFKRNDHVGKLNTYCTLLSNIIYYNLSQAAPGPGVRAVHPAVDVRGRQQLGRLRRRHLGARLRAAGTLQVWIKFGISKISDIFKFDSKNRKI